MSESETPISSTASCGVSIFFLPVSMIAPGWRKAPLPGGRAVLGAKTSLLQHCVRGRHGHPGGDLRRRLALARLHAEELLETAPAEEGLPQGAVLEADADAVRVGLAGQGVGAEPDF